MDHLAPPPDDFFDFPLRRVRLVRDALQSGAVGQCGRWLLTTRVNQSTKTISFQTETDVPSLTREGRVDTRKICRSLSFDTHESRLALPLSGPGRLMCFAPLHQRDGRAYRRLDRHLFSAWQSDPVAPTRDVTRRRFELHRYSPPQAFGMQRFI